MLWDFITASAFFISFGCQVYTPPFQLNIYLASPLLLTLAAAFSTSLSAVKWESLSCVGEHVLETNWTILEIIISLIKKLNTHRALQNLSHVQSFMVYSAPVLKTWWLSVFCLFLDLLDYHWNMFLNYKKIWYYWKIFPWVEINLTCSKPLVQRPLLQWCVIHAHFLVRILSQNNLIPLLFTFPLKNLHFSPREVLFLRGICKFTV